MAIDTVRIISPEIDEGTAWQLEQISVLRQGTDLSTGELLYSFTAGQLEGSFDSRIRLVVQRERWISVNGSAFKVPSPPYVELECSWTKILYGTNVVGCVENFQDTAQSVLDIVEVLASLEFEMAFGKSLDIEFHRAALWEVHRVDWAEMFVLHPDAIKDYFRQLERCVFPRRKIQKYGLHGIASYGSSTAIRVYWKGSDFRVHDKPILKNKLPQYLHLASYEDKQFTLSDDRVVTAKTATDLNSYKRAYRLVDALERLANYRLRAEVQINGPKLKYDFEEKLKDLDRQFPLVSEITDDYLKNIYHKEMFKLTKESEIEMETVRTNDAVFNRLSAEYPNKSQRVQSLYAFWLILCARGEATVKATTAKSQFYSKRAELVALGISWHGSDIQKIEDHNPKLPQDFKPFFTDSRRTSTAVRFDSPLHIHPATYFNVMNRHRFAA